MKKVFFSAAMAAALLASCGTANKTVSLAGEWDIVSVKGEKVSADNDAFLGFDVKEGRLYGNAGCNNIMGTLSVDSLEGAVELSQVAATRMMCRDMKLEGMVLEALEKVAGYKAADAGVELTDADGNVLFGLEKKKAADVSIADIDGEWFITGVEGKDVKVVEKTPFIIINAADTTVHGTGGCNIFNGGFVQVKNKPASLRFKQLISTMMAGPGMEQESVILPALEKVRSFEVKTDSTVSLLDGEKNEVIVLKKNNGKSLAE